MIKKGSEYRVIAVILTRECAKCHESDEMKLNRMADGMITPFLLQLLFIHGWKRYSEFHQQFKRIAFTYFLYSHVLARY